MEVSILNTNIRNISCLFKALHYIYLMILKQLYDFLIAIIVCFLAFSFIALLLILVGMLIVFIVDMVIKFVLFIFAFSLIATAICIVVSIISVMIHFFIGSDVKATPKNKKR